VTVRKSIREIAAEAGPVKAPEQPGLVRLREAVAAALLVACEGPAKLELFEAFSGWDRDLELERICRAGAVVLTELELERKPEAPKLREALEQFMRLPPHSVRP
jgi:hypothetical protein